MVQWMNVLQNSSFENPTQIPLGCRNSRAIALADWVSWQANWVVGWLADEMQVNFNFKFIVD